ncbi:MAG TPA: pyridoxal-phosphate dependent enzyme [Polyangiaceae bacterium]|nr:pyridoxal-phosphate dependent enzyme [Polyangiaceae bacterium]
MTATAWTVRALHQLWPSLGEKVKFAALAELPTPVSSLAPLAEALGRRGSQVYEKRDDLTSPVYGGNKVRTLEVLMADALAQGSTHLYSTGAYGSNHAAAAALHAPRVGLVPGIVVYPQPHSPSALENLEVILSRRPRPPVLDLPHWSALLFGMWLQAERSRRRGERATIMVPGGAIPLGALGYVSAALELALQIDERVLPAPRTVMLAAGSNCTTAGLLLGLSLAARRGIGFSKVPLLAAVRVTPWPVTSRVRILSLAARTGHLLERLSGESSFTVPRRELGRNLRILGQYLGSGYGEPTDSGREAMRLWKAHAGHDLETSYSGKSAAALVAAMRSSEFDGPLLFWSTKSSVPLPVVDPADLEWAPSRMRRWMERCRH